MNVIDDMEDASAALFMQLEIEEIEQQLSITIQKQRNGILWSGFGLLERTPSARDHALLLQRGNFQRIAASIEDRRTARSIASEYLRDESLFAASGYEETEERDERASRFSGRSVPSPIDTEMMDAEDVDGELLDAEEASQFSSYEGADASYGLPTRSFWHTMTTPKHTSHKCSACFDISDNTARVPCGHHYCEDCLENLFLASMADDSPFLLDAVPSRSLSIPCYHTYHPT